MKVTTIGVIAMGLVFFLALILIPGTTQAGTDDWTVEVSCDCSWSGSYGATGSSQSVDGTGSKTFSFEGTIAVATFQKQDEGGTLKIILKNNGEVVEESSTSAKYGIATVSGSSDGGGTGGCGSVLLAVAAIPLTMVGLVRIKTRR